MDGSVIVADDDRTIRTVLTQALTRAGCKVRATGSVSTLWRWIDEGEGDVVISDVNFPDGDAMDLMPGIKKRRSELPVIFVSAENSVMTAIRASEIGAYDYLPKPFDLKELLSKTARALSSGAKATPPVSENASDNQLPMVGSAPIMQEVYRLVARVLNTDLNVMISGESGTGKDLMAQTLHDLGNRKDQEFVKVQVSSATQAQLEGILIGGYEDHGIEQAPRKSTIYFDEVSEMEPRAQMILLDLLRSEAVKSRHYRIISSSRIPLDVLIGEGMFREDLFYRLNVVTIALPPLRDRVGDIPDLVNHFLHRAVVAGMPQRHISAGGLEKLRGANWPGNVRELENFINRLVLMSVEDEVNEAQITAALAQNASRQTKVAITDADGLSASVEAHLQRYFDLHGDDLPPAGLYARVLREIELPLIALTLSATRGNQIKAAELLGINRNTLRKKVAELEIQVTRSKKLM